MFHASAWWCWGTSGRKPLGGGESPRPRDWLIGGLSAADLENKPVLRALHPYYNKSRLRSGLLGWKFRECLPKFLGQNHPFWISGISPWLIPSFSRRGCRSPSAAAPEGGRPQTPTRRSSAWLSPDVGNNFPAHHAGATPLPRLKEFTQRPEAVVYERTIPPTRCAGHRRGPTKRARPMLTHRVPSRTSRPHLAENSPQDCFPGAQSPLHKGGFGMRRPGSPV